MSVLLADGHGRLSAVTGSPFAVGKMPVALAVADFNGDGEPDIAAANLINGNVSVLLASRRRRPPRSGSRSTMVISRPTILT